MKSPRQSHLTVSPSDLRCDICTNGSSSNLRITMTPILRLAFHYKEFNQLEAKERWKERLYGFVSGILVSVLASLIISWLS